MAKWITTGAGSYRRLPNGKYEMTWRPQGHAGPKLKRRVPWTAVEVRQFLAREADNRARASTGRHIVVSWEVAIASYNQQLTAKQTDAWYQKRLGMILSEMRAQGAPLACYSTSHATEWANARALALQSQKCQGWASTVGTELYMASGFFRFCLVVLHTIEYNPIAAVPRFQRRRKVQRDLTPQEYARVWQVSEPSVRDLLDWQLLTACRIGEACACRWDQLDRTAGVWTIPDRKAGDELKVPLCSDLLEILLRQPRVKPDDGLVWHRWVPPSMKAFSDRGIWCIRRHKCPYPVPLYGFKPGTPATTEWWDSVIVQRCAAAGLPAFSSHDLRRAASRWARNQAGLPTSDIQGLLGHSTVRTTELYATHDSMGSKRVQNALVGILRNAKQTKTG